MFCRAFPLLLALAATCARAQSWAPTLSTAAVWNTNATNATFASDRISALEVMSDLSGAARYSLGPSDSLQPGVHVAADWWPRFDLLTTFAGGAQLGWFHKFGIGPLAPTLSARVAADAIGARDDDRRGSATSAAFTIGKRTADFLHFALTEEISRLDTHEAVYGHHSAQTTLEVRYDATEAVQIAAAVFARNGDIVSYATPPRADLVALANRRTFADAFNRPFVAYSIKAPTLGARVEVSRALSTTVSAVVGYEYRNTKRSPLRYVNQLVSLSAVMQF